MAYGIKYKHFGETTENDLFVVGDTNYCLLSATLDMECGQAGELKMEIPKSNPAYGNIVFPSDEIIVYRDGSELWRGRPITNEQDFYLTGTVTCEGILAYLYDTFCPPYDFETSTTTTPKEFLNWIITKHNAKADSDKQFVLGTVSISEASDTIRRSSTDYDRCLNVIADKLVDSFGGYLQIGSKTSSGWTLNWVDSYGTQSSQRIELGSNILDIAKDVEYGDMVTALLPLGAKDEKTGKYLTISSVNDKSIYIQDDDLVAEHGFICDCVIWEDITVASNLLKKAQTYLSTATVPVESITVNAVDLALTDDTIEHINLGDTVDVVSEPHDINSYMEVSKMSLDLMNPSNDEIQFGTSAATLSSRTTATTRQALSEISDQGVTIRQINALYVTTEYLEANYIKTDQLSAIEAEIESAVIGHLSSDFARIEYLEAEDEYVLKMKAGEADVELLHIVNGSASGVLDAVTLNANQITAGTLAVDRLLIKDSEGNYKVATYNESGELEATTVNGSIITDRTITADHIVAGSLTSNEINVEDLFAQDITATGSITGATITTDSGVISGFTMKRVIDRTQTPDEAYGIPVEIHNCPNSNSSLNPTGYTDIDLLTITEMSLNENNYNVFLDTSTVPVGNTYYSQIYSDLKFDESGNIKYMNEASGHLIGACIILYDINGNELYEQFTDLSSSSHHKCVWRFPDDVSTADDEFETITINYDASSGKDIKSARVIAYLKASYTTSQSTYNIQTQAYFISCYNYFVKALAYNMTDISTRIDPSELGIYIGTNGFYLGCTMEDKYGGDDILTTFKTDSSTMTMNIGDTMVMELNSDSRYMGENVGYRIYMPILEVDTILGETINGSSFHTQHGEIGEYDSESNTTSVSLSADKYKNINSFTLSAGIYVVQANVTFSKYETTTRNVASISGTSATVNMKCVAANYGSNVLNITTIISATSSNTYYLVAKSSIANTITSNYYKIVRIA